MVLMVVAGWGSISLGADVGGFVDCKWQSLNDLVHKYRANLLPIFSWR